MSGIVKIIKITSV